MKINKSKIILLLIVSIVGIFSIFSYNSKKYSNSINIDDSNIKNDNMISMMLETSAGSGEYQESTASSWPTEGYIYNAELSKCENGSTLSWDNNKKTVVMNSNVSDKCYIYFDKEKIVYLADYVKAQYTGQGKNNLYLHDSTLENGAGDNSYRYAGPSDTTNNFVCFGYDSQDGTCPSDNLYRIIGVFDGEVKLIKYDYAKSTLLGTDGEYYNTYKGLEGSEDYGTNKGQNSKSEIGVYHWNRNNTNTWSESQLNTINLNKNYINNIGTKWSEKISDHTWKVGGNTYDNIRAQTAPTAYQNEINSPATNKTVNAKVGLMYVSDYMYAVPQDKWTLYGSNIYSSRDYRAAIGVNWMYMGLREWTLTPCTDYSNNAFNVHESGTVDYYNVKLDYAARPVLYLKSTIGYGGGSGTIDSPYILAD